MTRQHKATRRASFSGRRAAMKFPQDHEVVLERPIVVRCVACGQTVEIASHLNCQGGEA